MEEEKIEKLSFKEFYQLLKESEKTKLRDDVIKECGISYPSFYSKLNKGNYSTLEKREIEILAGRKFQW